jgi:hypothetical protein
MKKKVDEAKKDSRIISLASDIVAHVRERDHWGEVDALLSWVKRNVRYVNDPFGVELVQGALYTIQRGAGDCDDLSIILASLCAALGYNTAFKTIKADKRYPDEFSHVYVLIDIDNKWIPADPSQKTRPLGWEPPSYWGYQIWGYSTGVVRRIDAPAQSKTKGSSMLGNFISGLGRLDIKSAVISWLNRRNNNAGLVSQTEVPTGRVSNPYVDRKYDPEDHSYYGDYGGDAGGGYSIESKEELYERGEAIGVIYPLPRIAAPSYHDREGRNLDVKFEGRERYVDYPMDYNAVTHGTPEIR